LFFSFFSFFLDDDVDVDDVVGGLRGGEFRVLACADTGSEDPPWRAPVFKLIFDTYKELPRTSVDFPLEYIEGCWSHVIRPKDLSKL
jgi:hypothetical protein